MEGDRLCRVKISKFRSPPLSEILRPRGTILETWMPRNNSQHGNHNFQNHLQLHRTNAGFCYKRKMSDPASFHDQKHSSRRRGITVGGESHILDRGMLLATDSRAAVVGNPYHEKIESDSSKHPISWDPSSLHVPDLPQSRFHLHLSFPLGPFYQLPSAVLLFILCRPFQQMAP